MTLEPYNALAVGLWAVSIAHSLRGTAYPDAPWSRRAIAAAGTFVYLVGFSLAAMSLPAAAYIALVFPVVGLTAVLVTGNRPDTWQVSVGVLQVALMVLAGLILMEVV